MASLYITAIAYPCHMKWKPIGLWDVEAPTFSLDNRLTDGSEVSLTHRPPLTFRKITGSIFQLEVESTILRLEGLVQLMNPITSSGLEPTTFRLVAQCYRVPPLITAVMVTKCRLHSHLTWETKFQYILNNHNCFALSLSFCLSRKNVSRMTLPTKLVHKYIMTEVNFKVLGVIKHNFTKRVQLSSLSFPKNRNFYWNWSLTKAFTWFWHAYADESHPFRVSSIYISSYHHIHDALISSRIPSFRYHHILRGLANTYRLAFWKPSLNVPKIM
jgi:hypothetical protein